MIYENKDFSQQNIFFEFWQEMLYKDRIVRKRRKLAKSSRDTIRKQFTPDNDHKDPWENTFKRAMIWSFLSFTFYFILRSKKLEAVLRLVVPWHQSQVQNGLEGSQIQQTCGKA